MESFLNNANLPERCYGILPSTGDVIIINRGESGYYRTGLSSDDKELNRTLVDEYNEKIGVTKAQAAAMLAGSMFGWDVPGANPDCYDELGDFKNESLADKILFAENQKNPLSNDDAQKPNTLTQSHSEER